MTFTQQLNTQHEQALTTARSLFARLKANAESEGRALNASECASVEQATDVARQLKTRLDKANSDANQTAAIAQLTGGGSPYNGAGGLSRGSLGAQFVQSDVMKWLQDSRNTRAGAWQSPSTELFAANLTEDAASGGDLIITDFRPGILPLPTRPLAVADLFSISQTDSNSVTYMRESTFTNAANSVAEAATKPESTLIFDAVSDPVRKLAHWLPVTDEMLQDVPALQGYINARLRLGVQLEEDSQLLNGTTTPPDIVGILARTGLAAAVARGADTNAEAIAKQISAITVATNLAPDGLVLHPTNWLSIRLMKDTAGQYFGGGPFTSAAPATLWGLPVAVTTEIASGTALVGAFRSGAHIYRNGNLRVDISNSHSDFFIKNLVAIRAELREALCCFVPASFGIVTGLS